MNIKHYNIQANEYSDSYMSGYGEAQEIIEDISLNTSNTSYLDTLNLENNTNDFDDTTYILFLYPKDARIIHKLVNNKLDTLDYEGSIIFHEYPDKEALNDIVKQIDISFIGEDSLNDYVYQLVEVIFITELYKRRNNKNKD